MDCTEEQKEKKSDENPARVPFGLAETKKNVAPKRPRIREVTSRFMSSTVSSSSGIATLSSVKSPEIQSKRPQPVPRKPTPFPMDSKAPISEGPKRPPGEALRNLSVALHDEKFISDQPLKPAAANPVHITGDSASRIEGTSEKKRPVMSLFRESVDHQSENAKPLENLLPKPRTTGKSQVHPMSRSVNNNEKLSRAGQGRGKTPKPNPTSRSVSGAIGDGMIPSNASRAMPLDGRGRGTSLKGSEGNQIQTEDPNQITLSLSPPPQEPTLACMDSNTGIGETASSPESLSSDCTSHARMTVTRRSHESGTHGYIVPARFLQDTSSRSKGSSELRHSMTEADFSSSTSVRVRGTGHSGAGRLSKSSSQALPPPLPGPLPSVSPVKIIPGSSSPSRCLPSPTRSRGQPMLPPTVPLQNFRGSMAGPVVNFGADARKGKKGTNQIEDAHLLRLLHNRQLQWHFVNAKAEAAMNVQRITAEKMLYNMWMTTSELRDSVTVKHIELQKALHANKLRSVLSGQKAYLEDWAQLEQDHVSVLSEAIKNLEAATIRVPITDGVKANLEEVKESISSAVSVMDAMSSSVSSLLPQVEGMSILVSELAAVAAQEKALLDECGELLTTAGSLEVEESSLRVQLIQLKQDKCRGVG